jgi:hypothetical protein
MSTSLPVLGPPPAAMAADNQKQSEIVRWSNIIAENTKIYDDYFVQNNLPSPSHGLETPANVPLPLEIQKARDTVMEATTELQALILGPVLHVHNQTFQVRLPRDASAPRGRTGRKLTALLAIHSTRTSSASTASIIGDWRPRSRWARRSPSRRWPAGSVNRCRASDEYCCTA